MSKHLFASEKVMEDYLSALLDDDSDDDCQPIPEPLSKPKSIEVEKPIKFSSDETHELEKNQDIERLLEQVTINVDDPLDGKINEQVNLNISNTLDVENQSKNRGLSLSEQKTIQLAEPTPRVDFLPLHSNKEEVNSDELTLSDEPIKQNSLATLTVESTDLSTEKTESFPESDFQVLFFDVAGLTVAVPLTELGGIHNIEKTNSIFGKPEWFMGVMMHREAKINVVDTAQWVMPEKYTEELQDSLDYKYLIMLGDSAWGLACESLVNTVSLAPDDVKWRESSGKRPWLAGLVKDKMCALINVGALIELLEKGLGRSD